MQSLTNDEIEFLQHLKETEGFHIKGELVNRVLFRYTPSPDIQTYIRELEKCWAPVREYVEANINEASFIFILQYEESVSLYCKKFLGKVYNRLGVCITDGSFVGVHLRLLCDFDLPNEAEVRLISRILGSIEFVRGQIKKQFLKRMLIKP